MPLHFADLKARVKKRPVKRYHVDGFGEDNLYPQTVSLICQDSGRATSCIGKYAEFIEGLGFEDAAFSDSVINSDGITADELLSSCADDFARYGGVAIQVNYNVFGDVVEAIHVPYENVRIGIGDRDGWLAISDKWAEARIKKDDIDWLKPFDSTSVLDEIEEAGGLLNYTGQLYYFSQNGANTYGLTPIDPELESVVSDGQIKMSHFASLITAFMDNTLIVLRNRLEDNDSNDLNSTLADYQGADNAGALLVLDGIAPEDITIETLNSKKSENAHTTTENSIHERIRLLFSIPRILLSDDSRGGLSDQGNLLVESKLYYSEVTGKPRKKIEKAFTNIFSGWYYDINPSNDYTIEPIAKPVKAVEA